MEGLYPDSRMNGRNREPEPRGVSGVSIAPGRARGVCGDGESSEGGAVGEGFRKNSLVIGADQEKQRRGSMTVDLDKGHGAK